MLDMDEKDLAFVKKEKETITVDPSGNGDVKTLAKAIKLADPDDQIIVYPGIYKECVLIDKPLEIVGKIVDGVGPVFSADDKYACIHITAPAKLENITVKDVECYGIATEGANVQVTISNCEVSNCKSANIVIEQGSKAIINKCKIYNGGTVSVWAKNIGMAQIVDCEIFGTKGPNVCAEEKSNIFIKRSKIYDSCDVGVWANNTSAIQLDDCEVYNNTGYNVCARLKSDVLIKGGKLINAGDTDLRVDEFSKARSRGVEFTNVEGKAYATRDETSDVDLLIAYNAGYFTDSRDGQTYRTAIIGDQEWLAENLNFATEQSQVYNNDEAYASVYGRMYSWEGAKNAVPQGWHIPTQQEFEALFNYVKANTKEPIGVALKSKSSWMRHVKAGIGTDEFNFNALAMNLDLKQVIGWFPLGKDTSFWTAPAKEGGDPLIQKLSYDSNDVETSLGHHVAACSLRLVKDR